MATGTTTRPRSPRSGTAAAQTGPGQPGEPGCIRAAPAAKRLDDERPDDGAMAALAGDPP